ncbi:MAG TPA: class II glutamine amidotransferase [Jatrophihabitans sp.]|nr:class II glutamine amidotransferase [Jatrophihabitans sp.]
MCRLLGLVAASPASVRHLVGDKDLAQFTSLTSLHGDGWGTSWLPTPGATPHTHRSASSAAEDRDYAQAMATDAVARIVHLRWATVGYRVDPANTHPFVGDQIAFAHNGCIAPTDALDDMLTASTKGRLAGDTDSERYFALVCQEHDHAEGSVAPAVVRVASALRGHYPYASLNALILTRDELIIVHANSPEGAPMDELAALPGGAPHDHLDAYFLMRWRSTPDGSLVFASSGMPALGWTPLPEETVTAVDVRTMGMRHLPLTDYRVAAGRIA